MEFEVDTTVHCRMHCTDCTCKSSLKPWFCPKPTLQWEVEEYSMLFHKKNKTIGFSVGQSIVMCSVNPCNNSSGKLAIRNRDSTMEEIVIFGANVRQLSSFGITHPKYFDDFSLNVSFFLSWKRCKYYICTRRCWYCCDLNNAKQKKEETENKIHKLRLFINAVDSIFSCFIIKNGWLVFNHPDKASVIMSVDISNLSFNKYVASSSVTAQDDKISTA
jgi:hypothetical protein